MNTSNNSKVKKHYLFALTITFLVCILIISLNCCGSVSAAQNSNYPQPTQCNGADWNIGLPNNIVCSGTIRTYDPLEDDYKAKLVTGNWNRLRPDLATMNKFCQQYTGDSSAYATYGRMHNYCTLCDQRLAWFENNQWSSQAVCAGTLNVQKVTCATNCKSNIVCSTNSECDDSNAYTYDQCLNPGTATSVCSHSQIACLSNNDCGFTGFFGNEFCSSNDVFKFYRESKCNNPGTASSSCSVTETPQFLVECGVGACQSYGANYCKSNNVYHSRLCSSKGCATGACYTNYTTEESVVQTCDYGCSNGVCLPQCTNDNQCSADQICSNNNCVDIDCKSDLDCDDGKASTVDKCNNPGTVQSFCSNDAVRCNRNSDCGTNGVVGNTFCQDSNVFQNFITYTCNNPGTAQSYCTNSTNSQLKFSCTGNQICNSGSCVNPQINCSNHNECNDNNLYTADLCNNPGTAQSYCSHTGVNCVTNSDCGLTGFTGSEFCSSGNKVSKNFMNSTCISGGTILSHCELSIIPKVVNDCGAGICQNAVCFTNITCNSNANCGTNGYLNQLFCKNNNVFDKFVTYTCNNPGTASSSCSSSTEEKAVKTCDLGCSNGQCLTACTLDSDCDSDYTEKICANKNIYSDSHDFSCVQGKCVDDLSSVLVTRCKHSCDNGKCTNEASGNGGFPIEEESIETVLISGGDNSLYLSTSNYTSKLNATQKTNTLVVKPTRTNYFWLILLVALIIILLIIILIVMFSL